MVRYGLASSHHYIVWPTCASECFIEFNSTQRLAQREEQEVAKATSCSFSPPPLSLSPSLGVFGFQRGAGAHPMAAAADD